MYVVDICPAEVEPACGPHQQLDADKNAYPSVRFTHVEMFTLSHSDIGIDGNWATPQEPSGAAAESWRRRWHRPNVSTSGFNFVIEAVAAVRSGITNRQNSVRAIPTVLD